MTRVTRLIHNAGKYLRISIYPLPTHPTHNFTHKNGGNLDTLPGWPKKLHLNRPARCAGTRLFHGPLHHPVGEHICAQPFRMWKRLRFHPFLRVSLIFQRRKSDANKQDFEIKLNLTCHFNQPPNNREPNQIILHLWSKFGGSSLNEWWVIARTSSKWGKFWFWS